MNMSGDYPCVDQKYLDSNGQPSREYLELFSKGSELGDLLRSKNIIKKLVVCYLCMPGYHLKS